MAVWEDGQLKSRLEELALRAARRGRPMTTLFLTPPQALVARAIGGRCGVEAVLSAGYPGGERQLCCYCPPGEAAVFPIVCLRVDWPSRAQAPTHRDLLGSLMALGMDRATLGDILAWPDHALIFALPPMVGLIVQGLTQAGGTAVTASCVEALAGIEPPEDYTALHDTVASLRLDNILAAGMGTARGKTLEWIAQGRVSVNHEPTQHTDAKLKAGDLISIRGYGRLKLQEVGAPTRKCRLPVVLYRYAGKY